MLGPTRFRPNPNIGQFSIDETRCRAAVPHPPNTYPGFRQCRRAPRKGSEWCGTHQPDLIARRAEKAKLHAADSKRTIARSYAQDRRAKVSLALANAETFQLLMELRDREWSTPEFWKSVADGCRAYVESLPGPGAGSNRFGIEAVMEGAWDAAIRWLTGVESAPQREDGDGRTQSVDRIE